MPTKKPVKSVVKKVSKKISVEQAPSKKAGYRSHVPFLAVLLLVVGVSGYAIYSSVTSTNLYLNSSFQDLSALRNADSLVVSTVAPTTGSQAEETKPSPFTDVKYGDANASEIIGLYYAGVVTGYADGTFKPNNTVNRAEFMKMLAEAKDVDYADIDNEDLANCFTDVHDVATEWFAPPICAGKSLGWVNGYSDGTFKPTQNINKAEALKIVLTAFGFEIPASVSKGDKPYPDVAMRSLFAMTSDNLEKFQARPLVSWYAGVAKAAKDAGLILPTGNFDAGHELTRGEMAAIIYKAMVAKGGL